MSGLSRLNLVIEEIHADGDRTTASYRLPIVIDDMNRAVAQEIVAMHVNNLALNLEGVDKQIRPMQ